uniref:TrpR like protein, YerC/YecD n=1 Tax=candidate division WWE3 bacterium TaxID=2053526 RepID=A0A831YQ20_UNCKA
MAQISKRRMLPSIEKRVYELLWDSVAKSGTKKESEEFLTDLLTYTEKVVLAKRLAIAVLLMKGFNYDSIKDLLKVSGTTISRVQEYLRSEPVGFKRFAGKLVKEEFWREFADTLNQILPRYSRQPIPERVFRRRTPL